MPRAKRILIFLAKILVTVGALYLVFRRVAWNEVADYFLRASPSLLIMAFLLTLLSHLVSAFRFRAYVKAEGVACNTREMLTLHFQGTLLNLMLPGGVGGDVYKAAMLHRRYQMRAKRLTQISLSNRLNGMLWLILWAAILALGSRYFLDLATGISVFWPLLLLPVLLAGLALYAWISKRLLGESFSMQMRASAYSFVVQACMAATAWCIGLALGGDPRLLDAVILFMVGCAASSLPISVGGIGVREWVLMRGSLWIGLTPAFGVALAMVFFALYVAVNIPFLLVSGGMFAHGLVRKSRPFPHSCRKYRSVNIAPPFPPHRFLIAGLALLAVHWLMMGLGIYGLMFDESQYWLWGKMPAFGYYSKPPVIAWLMGISTALFGDGSFGTKCFAPLLHGGTALLVFHIAKRLYTEERIAAWAGISYLTLPAVSGSCAFFATDTPLLFCWALGLFAWVQALRQPNMARWWLLLGVALGFGLLSKYTMIVFPISAFLYLLISPQHRPLLLRPQPWLAAMLGLAIFAPNIWWNAQHGFVTLNHTEENVISKSVSLYPGDMLEFFGAQFGMMGPVIFSALLLSPFRGKFTDTQKLLHCFVWPLAFAGLGVSLMAGAQAQWIAPVYVPAVLVVVPWLLASFPKLFRVSFGLHLLLIPIFYAAPFLLTQTHSSWNPFPRLFVWNTLKEPVEQLLAEHPEATLVTDERKIATALSYQLRAADGTPHIVYKWNPDARAHDHYDLLTRAVDLRHRPLILLSREAQPRLMSVAAPDATALPDIALGRFLFHAFLIPDFYGFPEKQ